MIEDFKKIDPDMREHQRKEFEKVLLEIKPFVANRLEVETFGTFQHEYNDCGIQTAFLIWLWCHGVLGEHHVET